MKPATPLLDSPMNYSAFLILLSLRTKSHGYEIMKYVNNATKGLITIGPATMYRTIADFLNKDYIELVSDQESKKEYIITEKGSQLLKEQIAFIQLINQLALEGGNFDESH
ncbi:PadR family transcriptional regulator [Vagococcus sp. DIV0080]|uniref:PadR family transcriptional regulator n=1 Tax=Candidatus Vagococcus giribetii TaxID=2230876 RepID=A0ABS3HV59_9ENTE|nr:PadR family transcriptional regulator [Vagococcus sp. DIV0080]MBO0477644.1 PadR family transcriptional regulator [Vagococcus sp. DIV0080]